MIFIQSPDGPSGPAEPGQLLHCIDVARHSVSYECRIPGLAPSAGVRPMQAEAASCARLPQLT